MISAKTAEAANQPGEQAAARVRSASAVGEREQASRGGALSCAASRPGPMSRRRSIRAATSRRASGRRRAGPAPPAAAPANGRSSSAQPSGVTQRSHQRHEVSATIRSSEREGERPRRRSPVASRRVGASWLASAPTPTKTAATAAIASARKAEGPAARPPARSPTSRSPARRSARPAPTPASAARKRRAAADRSGEDELAAAGVLLGAQRPHRGEDAPQPRRRCERMPPVRQRRSRRP